MHRLPWLFRQLLLVAAWTLPGLPWAAGAQTNGLVLLLDFPAAPTNNLIIDDSGAGHNGTDVNESAVWEPYVAGRVDVMNFNGSLPAEIIVPSSPDFLATNGSIAFWMRSPSVLVKDTFQYGIILDHRSSSGDVIYQTPSGQIAVQPEAATASADDAFTSVANPTDGNWHHIAYVYQQGLGGTSALYIDGQLDSSITNSAAWDWDPAEELEIGASHDPFWAGYQGQLSDFRIYARNLSAAEVATLARQPSNAYSIMFTVPATNGAPTWFSLQQLEVNDQGWSPLPFTVTEVDATTAGGGAIFRTNDWLQYTPPAGPLAMDTFQYEVTDVAGNMATGLVTLNFSLPLPPAGQLTIAATGPPTNALAIQFAGTVGTYSVQASPDLVNWSNVGSRLAYPGGAFTFLDTNATDAQLFYRSTLGPSAPVVTNYTTGLNFGNPVGIYLGVEGSPQSPMSATILSLPAVGALYQANSHTPITNVPVLVSATNGLIYYEAPGPGVPVSTFTYKLTRQADGLDSLPATFTMNYVGQPVATTPKPQALENTPLLIHLTAIDYYLKFDPGTNEPFFIFVPTLNGGSLYQVAPDNVTPLTNDMISYNTYVLNTNGWVYYVPAPYVYGTLYENFIYQAQSPDGLKGAVIVLPIDILHVNQPVFFYDSTSTGSSAAPGLVSIFLNITSPDVPSASVRLVTLPARGLLYDNVVDAAHLISSTNYIFNSPDQLKYVTPANGQCPPDPNDYGSPYDTFQAIAWNPSEMETSRVATVTIDIPPPTPVPIVSTRLSFTNLENSIIVFNVAATNYPGQPQSTAMTVTGISAHGTFSLFGIPFLNVPLSLPPGTNYTITYQPATNYISSRDGVDSLTVEPQTATATGCPATIYFTELGPPALGGQTSLLVTTASDGSTITPGLINAVVIKPYDAGTNAILSLTVQTAAPAGGRLVLNSTNNLINIHTNNPVSLSFQGTAAALNHAIAGGILYYTTATTYASEVVMRLNDLGSTGIGTNTSTLTLAILVQTPISGGVVKGSHSIP